MTCTQAGTVCVNRAELYFEVHGTGEPLVLLSGFSGTSQDWKPTLDAWGPDFRVILPDFRGHGRSGILEKPFRHDEAAADVFAVLDHLGIGAFKGVGISAGGNVLLHMATRHPGRVEAMVLVSATPYFPAQARPIMRQYARNLSARDWERLRADHPGGDQQIEALLESVESFADSHDDLNFTSSQLATVETRTLIVQGDRDPLYPLELSVEMAKTIPNASLWIVPNAGHGPVIGERWPEFLARASAFLRK
ncbi:MAG TPA: alpha/beta fold hydrolase [Candidatus Cybelea sp.]|nr:alpha/beta fold hydrolase [Candidatus Cybelea sp.]